MLAEQISKALPWPPRVDPADLPLAIAQADSPALELAARTGYWLELNHAYLDRYRAHRDAEDAATQAAWALEETQESDSPTMHKLSAELIAERHAASVRCRA